MGILFTSAILTFLLILILYVLNFLFSGKRTTYIKEERIRDYTYKPQEEFDEKTDITTKMFVFELIQHCNAENEERERFYFLEIEQELLCKNIGKYHSTEINNLCGERVGIVDAFNNDTFSKEKHDDIKMYVNNIERNPYRVFVRTFTLDKGNKL